MTKNEAEAIERAFLAAAEVMLNAVAKLAAGGRVPFLENKMRDAIRSELKKVVSAK